jgi:hypothetical protein
MEKFYLSPNAYRKDTSNSLSGLPKKSELILITDLTNKKERLITFFVT